MNCRQVDMASTPRQLPTVASKLATAVAKSGASSVFLQLVDGASSLSTGANKLSLKQLVKYVQLVAASNTVDKLVKQATGCTKTCNMTTATCCTATGCKCGRSLHTA